MPVDYVHPVSIANGSMSIAGIVRRSRAFAHLIGHNHSMVMDH